MDKIINCSRYALSNIEISLHQVDLINKTLEGKKGENSRFKRFFLSIIYLIGASAGLYFSLMYKQISLAPFDEQMSLIVIFTAGISTSLFFLILLIRNLLEAKFYKVIYDSEKKTNQISKNLIKKKSICDSYYGLLETNVKSLDFDIDLGEDVEEILKKIEIKIASLEKRKTDGIKNLLVAIYYVAAFTVGAFLVLLMQNAVDSMIIDLVTGFDVSDLDAQNWANGIYGICACVGIFGGPIFARHYIENIKLIPLTDSLLFLIAFSGVLGFFATLLVAAIIALVIALVCVIVQAIIGIVLGILAFVAIIAIIVSLLSGG